MRNEDRNEDNGQGARMRYVKVERVGKSFDEVCWGQCRVER